MNDIYTIAEIGINHFGSEECATELIRAAARAKATAVKFQAYNPATLTKERSMKKFLKERHLSVAALKRLSHVARGCGVMFGVSVFSPGLMEEMKEAGVTLDFVKLPSCPEKARNYDVVKEVAGAADNTPIIISGGMTDSFVPMIDVVKSVNQYADITLMACVSAYPTPLPLANPRRILALRAEYPDMRIGFSCHCPHIMPAVMAVAYGAEVIEYHLSFEKSNCPDSHSSLLPYEFKELVEHVRWAEILSRDPEERKIHEVESPTRAACLRRNMK